MVVVPKCTGKVRLCTDLTELNKSVMREKHPLPSVEHVRTACLSQSFVKTWCQCSILADSTIQRILSPHHIYNTVWAVLLQLSLLWDLFCSRTLSKAHVPHSGGTGRCPVSDGWCAHLGHDTERARREAKEGVNMFAGSWSDTQWQVQVLKKQDKMSRTSHLDRSQMCFNWKSDSAWAIEVKSGEVNNFCYYFYISKSIFLDIQASL